MKRLALIITILALCVPCMGQMNQPFTGKVYGRQLQLIYPAGFSAYDPIEVLIGGVEVFGVDPSGNITGGTFNGVDIATLSAASHARAHSTVSATDHSDWPAGVSLTELGYIGGLTSDAQGQLNAKAPITNPEFAGTVTIPAGGLMAGSDITTLGRLTVDDDIIVGQTVDGVDLSAHTHSAAAGHGAKISAGNVTSTPAGNIAATDVQAAIEELDDEKMESGVRVYTVAPSGADYTTIQAALDAISDAATGNRYLVLVWPGVSTTYSPEPYVDVVFTDQLNIAARRSWGSNPDTGTMPISPPTVLPYSAVVNLRFDDSDDYVMTADAAWGGLSPAVYLSRVGIPASLAIETGDVGAAGMLTTTNLRLLYVGYGWEICNHSSDKTNPGTEALFISQAEAGRAAIEGYGIDCAVKTFIRPGEWSSPSLLSAAGLASSAADYLRHTYEVSYCASTGVQENVIGPFPQHIQGNVGLLLTNALIPSQAAADAFVEGLCSPGMRTSLYTHNEINISHANLRYLINSLVAARNAGKLGIVNASTLATAQLSPRYTSGGNILVADPGGLYDNGFEVNDTIDSTTPGMGWHTEAPGGYAGGGATTYTVVSDGDVGGGTYALEMAAAASANPMWGDTCLTQWFSAEPNRGYLLTFKAKAMGAGSAEAFAAFKRYDRPNGVWISSGITVQALTQTTAFQWTIDNSGWATYYCTFGNSKSPTEIEVLVGIEAGQTVRFDDFSIIPL